MNYYSYSDARDIITRNMDKNFLQTLPCDACVFYANGNGCSIPFMDREKGRGKRFVWRECEGCTEGKSCIKASLNQAIGCSGFFPSQPYSFAFNQNPLLGSMAAEY
jgi:hypothetical protein